MFCRICQQLVCETIFLKKTHKRFELYGMVTGNKKMLLQYTNTCTKKFVGELSRKLLLGTLSYQKLLAFMVAGMVLHMLLTLPQPNSEFTVSNKSGHQNVLLSTTYLLLSHIILKACRSYYFSKHLILQYCRGPNNVHQHKQRNPPQH